MEITIEPIVPLRRCGHKLSYKSQDNRSHLNYDGQKYAELRPQPSRIAGTDHTHHTDLKKTSPLRKETVVRESHPTAIISRAESISRLQPQTHLHPDWERRAPCTAARQKLSPHNVSSGCGRLAGLGRLLRACRHFSRDHIAGFGYIFLGIGGCIQETHAITRYTTGTMTTQ